MEQKVLVKSIQEHTARALWEVKNIIECVPDDLWDSNYCDMPMWKHIYHMLHSLDLWFINPRDKNFKEPDFHEPDLNNLDVYASKKLSRIEINRYYSDIEAKISAYLASLNDRDLTRYPAACEYSVFTLILAQHRHLHTHMGMIMGFVVAATGLWPRVLGLEGTFPKGDYSKYF